MYATMILMSKPRMIASEHKGLYPYPGKTSPTRRCLVFDHIKIKNKAL